MMNVEIVYADTKQQWIVPVTLPVAATVQQAILISEILKLCPDIDLQINKVGIFSVIVELDHVLTEGDRIEIYRPLAMDPITRRFQRVAKQRKKS